MSARMGGRGSGGGIRAFVTQAVAEHIEKTEEQLERDVRDVAKMARKSVKALSPVRTGGYASGWSMRVKNKGGHVEAVVHNAKKPGLPHLIEKGHAKRDGGRTAGRPHVAPAYEEARAELLRRTGAR